MRKVLILGLIAVLFVSVLSLTGYGGEKSTPDPKDFVTYKSPQGLFELMVPKGLPVMREHKYGIVYGSPDADMIIAGGVRLFDEKDEVKVDMAYIKEKVDETIKDIMKSNKGEKVVEGPKEYKNGIFMIMETENPPFPPKEEQKEKKKYYLTMYVTVKNEKSLALIAYFPKDKYPDFKKDVEFMIDHLK